MKNQTLDEVRRLAEPQPGPAAIRIVQEILQGFEASTFNEMFPDAYQELKKYRVDMEVSVQVVLNNSKCGHLVSPGKE